MTNRAPTVDDYRCALVEAGHIDANTFLDIKKSAQVRGTSIETVLLDRAMITKEGLGQALAGRFGLQYAELSLRSIDEKVLQTIPEAVARAHQIIAYDASPEMLQVATAEANHFETVANIEKKVGKHVDVAYTTSADIRDALRLYNGNLKERLDSMIAVLADGTISGEGAVIPEGGESSISRLVRMIVDYAVALRASDIHIEPHEGQGVVRFRISGLLQPIITYSLDYHEQMIQRVKILARLRTDESAAPQDGHFLHVGDGSFIDVRVSIVPVSGGENVVMRLLMRSSGVLSLESTGLSAEGSQVVRRASARSHGMILAVGPTGAGKTTTLYTIVHMIRKPEINIMTVEDPIEYELDGVQQIQVNRSKDVSFETGLRSIVRQDPDVVLVGEIRDKETVHMATEAAMTGHLILSTMHANDTATALLRLFEFDVEPYVVSSTVNLVVAQRLVQKICEVCKESSRITDEEAANIEVVSPSVASKLRVATGQQNLSGARVFRGRGCGACGNKGYAGRIGIFELLEITDDMRVLLTKKPTALEIQQLAEKEGMAPLLDDAVNKIMQGNTTVQEVLRAVNI